MCYNRAVINIARRTKTIKDIFETSDRFERFVLLVDAAHKGISRVKQNIVADTPAKSVHTMWLYKLLKNPDGMTASELAAENNIDRSLISRELATLAQEGYITIDSQGKRRSYNSRIRLTEKGREIAEGIKKIAYEAQCAIGDGIAQNDLVVFYSVLEAICSNFEKLENTEKEN